MKLTQEQQAAFDETLDGVVARIREKSEHFLWCGALDEERYAKKKYLLADVLIASAMRDIVQEMMSGARPAVIADHFNLSHF